MIECVANASEGRDAAVIARLAEAAQAPGTRLLDIHSDPDHNRSVLTFVGSEDAVGSGALRLAIEAARSIDLRRHRGVHPRTGALDVVPFVPLEGATLEDCVAVARRVGAAIARETGIPVFLYGRAASVEARAALSVLRRGGLDGLAARIGGPGWLPDYGPARLHPSAGVAAVGARPLLVAYNVCIAGLDLEGARAIARDVRGAHGGLPGVQALAFRLDEAGCVQISMNLTDVAATSVPAAFERVARLAESHGLRVASSEIVGLAPRRALCGATASELLLTDTIEPHVLEDRVEAACP